MDLSGIKIEVASHVRRILSYDEEDWQDVWESQYDNKIQDYKHPLINEITEALKSLGINIIKHKFLLRSHYEHHNG